MTLERITNKINEDAKAHAAVIRKEAKEQAYHIIEEAKAESQKQKEAIAAEGKLEAQTKKERILAAAALSSRKQELAEFQVLLDQCFTLAVDKLLKLPDEEYQQLIEKMVQSVEGSEQMEFVPIPKEQKGGFLLKNKDITLNFSFSALAENAKERLQQDVVKILGW